ncbi:MAG: Uma2 family endonuclease [Planctomycetaceae bacterium]|nr:Uma2 family endonuclease [Planctomycetaceae bacterium]
MSTTVDHQSTTAPSDQSTAGDSTLADLVERLGGIPLDRIKLHPAPGTATEEDVIRYKCCELLDGVIVEKDMGWEESGWQQILGWFIENYLRMNRIAVLAGADGLTRLKPGRVRIPDLGVYRLDRFPNGKAERVAICNIAPDWAIEVLSRSNTKREMEEKREHFFAAGTSRIWIVDPRKRTIEDWTSKKSMSILTADDTADLGEILPGFTLNIREWFDEVDATFEATDG